MRTQFILVKGQDQNDISLPGVAQIHGITIDNPSGSWLQLFPTFDYIPPYTNGYARTFVGGVVSVDVRFVEGPAGQRSTLDGDNGLLVIHSEPIGSSPGADSGKGFVNRGEQPEVRATQITLPYPTGGNGSSTVTDLLGNDENRRLRIYGAAFRTVDAVGNPRRPNELVSIDIDETPYILNVSLTAICAVNLTPNKFYEYQATPQPWLDLAVGSELELFLRGDDTTIPNLNALVEVLFSIL